MSSEDPEMRVSTSSDSQSENEHPVDDVIRRALKRGSALKQNSPAIDNAPSTDTADRKKRKRRSQTAEPGSERLSDQTDEKRSKRSKAITEQLASTPPIGVTVVDEGQHVRNPEMQRLLRGARQVPFILLVTWNSDLIQTCNLQHMQQHISYVQLCSCSDNRGCVSLFEWCSALLDYAFNAPQVWYQPCSRHQHQCFNAEAVTCFLHQAVTHVQSKHCAGTLMTKLKKLARNASDVARGAIYNLNARTSQSVCHVPSVRNLATTNPNVPAVCFSLTHRISLCHVTLPWGSTDVPSCCNLDCEVWHACC